MIPIEEFSQENTAARTQFRGTGLVLSIAKRYMELMGIDVAMPPLCKGG